MLPAERCRYVEPDRNPASRLLGHIELFHAGDPVLRYPRDEVHPFLDTFLGRKCRRGVRIDLPKLDAAIGDSEIGSAIVQTGDLEGVSDLCGIVAGGHVTILLLYLRGIDM